MAVATAVLRPKQSERLAATLYSPPETWTSQVRALRNGMTPGSSRWTSAPSESRSSWQASVRMLRLFMGRLQGAVRASRRSRRSRRSGAGTDHLAHFYPCVFWKPDETDAAER